MRSRAVGYMALSALGFSAMSVLVKLAAREMPTGEIVLARAVITLVLSFVLVRRAGLSPWGTQRGKPARARRRSGSRAWRSTTCRSRGCRSPRRPRCRTRSRCSPRCSRGGCSASSVGWAAAFALACGLGGVVLVARPGGGGGDPVGIACALAAAVSSSLAYVTVRQLSRTEHPLVIVFYFPLVATPLAIPWAAADCVWPSARGWLLLAGVGVRPRSARCS